MAKRAWWLRLGLLSFYLLPACTLQAPTADDLPVDGEDAIVGGRKVASSDPIADVTVAIVDPSPDIGQFCTGIVIERDLVLSAAHCFDDRTRTAFVRIGKSESASIRVRAVAVHGQYSALRRTRYDKTIEEVTSAAEITMPTTPLNDIALVWLEAPLPATAVPATIVSSRADLTGAEVVSAGFGCTTTACRGQSDVLRKTTMQVVASAPASNLVVLESGARRGTCFGDSGGPDFVVSAKGIKVLALISTGPDACELGISVDTVLAPYLGWIRATPASLRAGGRSSAFKRLTY